MKRSVIFVLTMVFMMFGACTPQAPISEGSVEPTTSAEVTPAEYYPDFVFSGSTEDAHTLFLFNIETGEQKALENVEPMAYGPAFAPDGRKIVYYTHETEDQWTLWLYDLDQEKSQVLVREVGILCWAPVWSPDGSIILFTKSVMSPTWHSEIWEVRPDGTGLKPLIQTEAQGAAVSPDGEKLVYFDYREDGGDLWLCDRNGKNPVKLTDNPKEDWWPSFSPDGKTLVYQANLEGTFEIMSMDLETLEITQLTQNDFDDEEPKFSPSGQSLIYASFRSAEFDIYHMNVDGTDQKALTKVQDQSINADWYPLAPY